GIRPSSDSSAIGNFPISSLDKFPSVRIDYAVRTIDYVVRGAMTAARSVLPNGQSRGVVMVDVARLAGVSQKTVSRVVNGAPHVRPDVRERVNRAIEELGYRPNVAAQALARERSHTIGVLALGTRFFGPSRRVFPPEQKAGRWGSPLVLFRVPICPRAVSPTESTRC